MNYLKYTLVVLTALTLTNTSTAQTSGYDKLGMQAMMKGDYKSAVTQLEKAGQKTPNNANVLKMLGYSYYQCRSYENAISTYTKLIGLKPAEYETYYYRGKASQNIANAPKEAASATRETYYQNAIKDFTKALELSNDADAQLLQNRGITYKDYGIFKSYKAKKKADRQACIVLFNNSIADFQKILVLQPQRKDIIALVDYVKAQAVSLK